MYERATRTAEVFAPNKVLVRGSATLRTRKVILAAGVVYALGSVLGVIALGAATSAVKAGGNTGNGTLVLDATTPELANAPVGVTTIRFATATEFQMIGPDGRSYGEFEIGGATGNNVTVNAEFKFALTQGATPFAAGDGFDLTIAPAGQTNGLDKAKLAASASIDGSQEPSLILPYAVDATGGDTETVVYESGDFNKEALVLGAGITLAAIRERLRRLNITFA